MSRIFNFIKRKWSWACQNKLFWANIALVIGTWAFVFTWPAPTVAGTPSDFRLRAWGMFLQLLGAYTVWHDLTGTAREFGAGGLLQRNLAWLKAGLGLGRVVLSASGTAISSTSGSGRIRQRPAMDKNASLDERIAVLERYVEYIDIDVAGAFAELTQQKHELSAKIDEKARVLQAAIRSTEVRLKNALVGNYSVLLFGAAWLFVGIVLSSVAPEIAKLVAGDYRIVWAVI